MTKDDISTAQAYLTQADPSLGDLIAHQTLEPLQLRRDYFQSLCRSIIGQQVSVAAASAIFTRFSDVTKLSPDVVAELNEPASKAIGLSRQKLSYLRDLAGHFVENPNIYNHLGTLSDEEVIKELVAVKGIGVWTAQMFLIFTLARPDVFAPDDVGLQNALMQMYNWSVLPSKNELQNVSLKWSPYRTVASLHLWQSLKNTP